MLGFTLPPENWLPLQLWVIAGLAWLMAGCGTGPIVPADPSAFVSDVRFETLPDRKQIDAEFGWTVGKGQFAECSFRPHPRLPRLYGGREVIEPKWWPTTLVLFRRGSNWRDQRAYWLGLTRYQKKRLLDLRTPHQFRPIPLQHDRRGWHAANYPGDPEYPTYVEEHPERVYCWTFLAIDPELSGEFEYEVLAFPTQTGDVLSYDLGEPLVLKRGIFRIDPTAQD